MLFQVIEKETNNTDQKQASTHMLIRVNMQNLMGSKQYKKTIDNFRQC